MPPRLARKRSHPEHYAVVANTRQRHNQDTCVAVANQCHLKHSDGDILRVNEGHDHDKAVNPCAPVGWIIVTDSDNEEVFLRLLPTH